MAELDIWRDETIMDDKHLPDQLVQCPQGLFPRPINGRPAKTVCRIFRFIGKFTARALYDGRLIDLPFSVPLMKLLRGDKLEYADLKHVDAALYKQLEKMRKLVVAKRTIEDEESLSESEKRQQIEQLLLDGQVTIADMCLSFTMPGFPDIELEEGGSNLDVTIWNLDRYLDLVVQYTLFDGIEQQVNALRNGFDSLVPLKMLRLFTVREMEDVICGCDEEWNEQMLIESTKCDHGFSHSSLTVRYLFQVLSEMNRDERRSFLRFCTGSPKLPFGGLTNLSPRLTIVRKTMENDESPDTYLPSVMTCQNYLKLPEYSSVEVMREQLLKAITLGQDAFLLS